MNKNKPTYQELGKRLTQLEQQIENGRLQLEAAKQIENELKWTKDALLKSEKLLDGIIEHSPCSTWISDDKGTLIRLNQVCRDVLHITDEDVIGKYNVLQDRLVEEQGLMPLVRRVFEQGETVRFTMRYDSSPLRRDATRQPTDLTLDIAISPVLDAQKRVAHAIIQHIDITDRKLALDQLRQLVNEQRAILNAIRMGICYDKNRILQWINPEFATMFGYEASELQGANWSPLYSNPEDYKRVGKDGYAQLARGEVYWIESLMKNKNGGVFWCAISGQAIDPANMDEGSIWVLHDISKRKQAEDELRCERIFTEAVLSSIPGLLYLYDDQEKLIRWNKQHETLTGYSAEELSHIHLMDWYRGEPEEAARIDAAIKRIVEQGYAQEEAKLVTRSGKRIPFYHTAVSVEIDGRKYFVGIGIDVTERKRAEEALRTSEERFKRLLQNSNDMFVVMDAECIQNSIGGPVERILGYKPDELIGTNGLEYVHPDDLDSVGKVLAEVMKQPGVILRVECRLRHKNGSYVNVESVGSNLLHVPVVKGIVLNNRDITERKNAERETVRLQEQLQQAMKMEAVGRLAGGIAHDFNNLLTVIAGNVELIQMDVNCSDPLAPYLNEIFNATESASSLTRQLLAFSRRQIIEPKVINLNDLIESLHKMLTRIIGEDINFQKVLSQDLGSVIIDPGQFEQVMVNLAVNARDAMPEGGRLLIETANVELDENYCSQHPQIAAGNYVLLAVSDTGHGMNEEVKKHVFEPFFTTKPKGRGTGLGLATIFGAVKQAGGAIEVYSEVGAGTTFKIYLPKIEKPADKLAKGKSSPNLVQGNETVLIVEDEASVRDLALRMLKRLGYKVLHASNGGEAFMLVEKSAERIDLLMSDVVMPGMNGRELAKRLLKLHPEMKVLFTSGYTENVIVHHGILEEKLNFIGKPYSIQALARKIREVLDQNQSDK